MLIDSQLISKGMSWSKDAFKVNKYKAYVEISEKQQNRVSESNTGKESIERGVLGIDLTNQKEKSKDLSYSSESSIPLHFILTTLQKCLRKK